MTGGAALRKRSADDAAWILLLIAYTCATAYSAHLLTVLLDLPAACPACLILDVVNLASLLLAFAAISRAASLIQWVHGHGSRLGRPALVFAVAFAVVFATGTGIAKLLLVEPEGTVTVATAYELVEGIGTRGREEILSSSIGAPVKGPVNARIVIVEFIDFECPYCRRLARSMQRLYDRYPKDVQIRFMHYPLHRSCNPTTAAEIHLGACLAARAAVCAQAQGRFWELHDSLFDHFAGSEWLSWSDVRGMAEDAELDLDRFDSCIDSDGSRSHIGSDSEAAIRIFRRAGLEPGGPPFFFVNGLLVRGARPFDDIDALVQRELRETR
jgi:protein-disulfide isomerase